MQSVNAVHVGDWHFWQFPRNPLTLAGKRLLGVGNLALRRARAFRKDRAPLLVDRLVALEPDWALFSGDFTTTSLESEFREARQIIAPLDAKMPGRIRAVPGNHDRYTRRDLREKTCDRFLDDWASKERWPYAEKIADGLWVLGIDPTTSNGMSCFGRLTDETMEALTKWRNAHAHEIREVWVLCHFPPEEPANGPHHDRGPQLRGGDRLVEFLGGLGVRVFYLHGHHHYRWAYGSPTAPNLTYLNAGAPLMRRKAPEPDLGFLQLLRENETTAVRVHTCDVASNTWSVKEVTLPGLGELVVLQ